MSLENQIETLDSGAEHSTSRITQIYAEKMHAARSTRSMQGERRVVTILFCDVSGSTQIAGSLDPEVWAEIMH